MKKEGNRQQNMNKLRIKAIVFSILIFILISFVSAEQNISLNKDLNSTIEQKAVLCLKQSKQDFIELEKEGFSVQRVNDSLRQLENLFNSQVVLKEKKRNYDFSLVLPYCGDIKQLKGLAFNSRDELIALKKFYSESVSGLNTSSIDEIINETEREIKNERYEKISPLIEKAYKEIINVKSRQTTLNIFYETTTKSLKKFLYRNWKYLVSAFVFFIIMYFIYKKTILKWIIKRKIKNLELRKNTLKNMIMETQRDYFQHGKISEGVFNTKTKKLAELTRDIDRQIPLLHESLAKLEWKNKKK